MSAKQGAEAPEVTQTTMESDRSCCQPFPQPNTSNCTIDCSLGFLACCRGKEEKQQGEGKDREGGKVGPGLALVGN